MLIDNEDLKEVKETFHGFAVEAKRMLKYGCWTGFITVPSDHPWSISHNSITVHGGVTYYKNTIKGISVGFDCAHFGDALPQWASRSQKIMESNLIPTNLQLYNLHRKIKLLL